MPSAFLEVALKTAKEGYPVFPLKPGGKTPIYIGGFHTATSDEEHIREWWRINANTGVPTGAVSGISVVDVDGSEGRDSIRKTFKNSPLPPTRVHQTPHGRDWQKAMNFWIHGAGIPYTSGETYYRSPLRRMIMPGEITPCGC